MSVEVKRIGREGEPFGYKMPRETCDRTWGMLLESMVAIWYTFDMASYDKRKEELPRPYQLDPAERS